MSVKHMWYEDAVRRCPKQSVLVDAVTERAPLLAQFPMMESTGLVAHNYEEIGSITAAGSVDLDAPLPEVKMDTNLKEVPLGKIGGKMPVGMDKALSAGGPQAYFQSKLPTILTETAGDIESAAFSNNFRNFSLNNSKAIDAGGTGNVYTFYCITWTPEEISGLWSPRGPGNGKVFDIGLINGGNTYEDSEGTLIYGAYLQTYFGLLLANSRYVATIDNVNLANPPTEVEMDDMITDARGQVGGSTIIYAHPKAKNFLNQYKGSALQTVNADMGLNRVVDMWNGIPILTSYNLGTNTNVSI